MAITSLMTLSPWNSSNSCRKSLLLFLFPLNIAGTTPHSLFVSCHSPVPFAPTPASAPGGGEGDRCGGCWWAISESNEGVKGQTGIGGCVSGNHYC
jgi:hypothetical protein